jgi:hypothetical protein
MSTTRRLLVLAALIGTIFAGSSAAAQASFAENVKVTATPFSIGTASVAVPTTGPGSLTCGKTTATMGLTWTKSTAPQVIGYLVTVYFSDGYTQTVQKTATDTSWTQSITLYNVTAYAVRYTVTTQTTYGWTAESAPTGWFQC